jgi:phage terminase small subunit
MSALKNTRHERFAQELAGGKSASEAYAIAGYSPNRRNASVLRRHQDIQSRLGELLAIRDKSAEQATERAVEALALSREWVLSRLQKNVQEALGERPVRVRFLPKGAVEPVEVEITARDPAAANRGLELLGKELGMFIERSEVTRRVTLEELIFASYNRGGRSEEPGLIEALAEESGASK